MDNHSLKMGLWVQKMKTSYLGKFSKLGFNGL